MIDPSVAREGLLSPIRHPQRGNSRRLVSHGPSHRRCQPTHGGNHGALARQNVPGIQLVCTVVW